MTRDAYNARMRVYMAERYRRRKRELIKRLGGQCVWCSSRRRIEFDHKDPSTKSFVVGRRLAGISQQRLEAEIPKLQLLCRKCHEKKTVDNHECGRLRPLPPHGTEARYLSKRGRCRCQECHSAAVRARRRRDGRNPDAPIRYTNRDPEHGTRARYVRKCRCRECRRANANYARLLRRAG